MYAISCFVFIIALLTTLLLIKVTQGLTGAGSALLQVGVLFMHFIKKWFLGRTPRQAYAVTFLMPQVISSSNARHIFLIIISTIQADFGLVLPRISLLATIALTYSVLSPVINGLATVAFFLFFFAWKFRKFFPLHKAQSGNVACRSAHMGV